MSSTTYRKKITDEVTKFYKNAPVSYADESNTEAKEIAAKIGDK